MAFGRDLSLANRLISALPATERALFIEHCELVELRLGEVPGHAAPRHRYAYFPVDGFVAIVVPAGDTPGAQAGMVGMVGREGMFPTSLALGVTVPCFGFRVQGAGRAFRVKHDALLLLQRENQCLSEVLGRYVAACQVQLALQVVCMNHHTVGQRLARWLLTTRDRAHSKELFVTHQMLAFMLGVRRESVSRTASIFEKRGLLSYSHGYVMLLDEPGLENTSCSCYQTGLLAFERTLGIPDKPWAARSAHDAVHR